MHTHTHIHIPALFWGFMKDWLLCRGLEKDVPKPFMPGCWPRSDVWPLVRLMPPPALGLTDMMRWAMSGMPPVRARVCVFARACEHMARLDGVCTGASLGVAAVVCGIEWAQATADSCAAEQLT